MSVTYGLEDRSHANCAAQQQMAGAGLAWMLAVWLVVPLTLRLSILASRAVFTQQVSTSELLIWIVLGGVQDLFVAFEAVLVMVLLGKAYHRAPRAVTVSACALFFLFQAYVLFDHLLYRAIHIRMDISYFSFFTEADSFLDSAIDTGLWHFLAGLVAIALISGCLYRSFRRRLPQMRLTMPAALAMTLAAVVAIGSMIWLPADTTYCLNNTVLDAQYAVVKELVCPTNQPEVDKATLASVQQLVPFSQAELFEYTDPEYPLLKDTTGFTGEKQWEIPIAPGERPHVVFLFMESWGAADIGVLGSRHGASPQFDRLSQRGMLFTNFYACGVQTARAAIASLYGIPPRFTKRAVQAQVPDLPLIGIPDLFKRQGYRTAYFHNGSLAYQNMGLFYRNHGYDQVWDRRQLLKRFPKLSSTSWGLDDEYLMPWVAQWIDRQNRAGTPTFTTMLTVTHHHPWGSPEGYKPPKFNVPDPVYKRYLESFHYADHCLGMFVDELRKRGLDKKTVLFVMADTPNPMGQHYNNYMLVHHCFEENVHIPLLILAPGRLDRGVVIDEVASQVDLLPTVMDMFAMTGLNHAVGTSLVRKVPDRIAYFSNPFIHGYLGLRHNSYKFVYTVDMRSSSLFDLSTDPMERHNLAHQHPELTAQYRRQVLALSQLMDGLYNEKRLAPPR